MVNYPLLTELLNLSNVRVIHYQLVGQQRLNLFVESTLEAAVCPNCQQVSLAVHDVSEPQWLRDLPIWDRRCWLGYAPRGFKCACCDNTFVERVAWREAGVDYTARYAQFLYDHARREPLAQIAQAEGLSEDQVQGMFERAAKKRLPDAATRA